MVWINIGVLATIFGFFGLTWYSVLTAIFALSVMGGGFGRAESGCRKVIRYSEKKSKGARF